MSADQLHNLTSWEEMLRINYTKLYTTGVTHDSSSGVIDTMAFRIAGIVQEEGGQLNHVYVDMGSGPQALELQALTTCPGLSDWDMHTVDIANIPDYRLLAGSFGNVHHHCQTARNMSFLSDGLVGLAVSSMALDLMPPEAMDEVVRVMQLGGKFLVNLHYRQDNYSSWPSEFRAAMDKLNRPYPNEKAISDEFTARGLSVESVQKLHDCGLNRLSDWPITYWAVEATKADRVNCV